MRSKDRTSILIFLSALILLIVINTLPLFALEDIANQQITEKLPKALVPVAAESLGKSDPSFHIQDNDKLQAETAPHGLHTEFSQNGVIFTRGNHDVRMILSGSKAVEPHQVSENRIEYKRGNITEWYVNSPFGLEQGFTFQNDPDDSNKVVIQIDLETDLKTKAAVSGRSISFHDNEKNRIFTYGKLYTYDSNGKELPSTMVLADSSIVITVDDSDATYPIVIDPFVFLQNIFASNEVRNFGTAMAISGDAAIVGSPNNASNDAGTAIIFRRNANTGLWEEDILTASDAASGDAFGSSVGISGDTAIVGASAENNQGAAYIFEHDGLGNWIQVQKLTAATRANGDLFGAGSDIDGTFAVVGAPGNTPIPGANGAGAIYIYERNAGIWPTTETQKLQSNTPLTDDMMGASVAIDGNTAVAGAIRTNSAPGSAFAFERSMAGVWSQVQEMQSSNGTNIDGFGTAVDISLNTIVVGAPFTLTGGGGDNPGMVPRGSVYVFERDTNPPNNWPPTETQELGPIGPFGVPDDHEFGAHVSIFGNILGVGAPGAITNMQETSVLGQVFEFRRGATMWNLEEQILLGIPDPLPGPVPIPVIGFSFGNGVAVSGGTLYAGVLFNNILGAPPGTFSALHIREGAASITIEKITNPSGGLNFGFEGTGFPATCNLDGAFTMDDTDTITCSLFPLPNYRVEETDAQGFDLSISCTGASDATISGNAVSINLLDDENVVCTFTNSNLTPITANVSLTKFGAGMCHVTSNPVGIDCDDDCDVDDADFNIGETITLELVSVEPGTVFEGFDGQDCPGGVVTNIQDDVACSAFCIFPLTTTVRVTKQGTGQCTVISDPVGIDCGPLCDTDIGIFPVGFEVDLLPVVPEPGSTFDGFTGDQDCEDGVVLPMTQLPPTNCLANCNLIPVTLTVNKEGMGQCTVVSDPVGIDCGPSCMQDSSQFGFGTTISLLPVIAEPGSTFVGFSGPDNCLDGTVNEIEEDTICGVICDEIPPDVVSLAVVKEGGGQCSVNSVPPGIDCDFDCAFDSEVFPIGTTIDLTDVEAAPGSIFAGFEGDNCDEGIVENIQENTTCILNCILPEPENPRAVPTMSEWGLIVTALLLGAIATIGLVFRRRQSFN